MMPDIEIGGSQTGESKRRHDIPHAQKTNLRCTLDHRPRVRLPNPSVLTPVTEIERRRRAAAEPDDVDRLIALRPGEAQLVVGLVQTNEFSGAKAAADHSADDAEPCANARLVAVSSVSAIGVICIEEAADVGVSVLYIVVFRLIPRAIERK